MYDKIGKTSSEAVERATGKSWDDWVVLIDKLGGDKLTHKQIARTLWDKKLIKRQKSWPDGRSFNVGWWCQMVTVGYEYAKNRRRVGETVTQGFEIGVQKTLLANAKEIWDLITSKKGVEIWLGKGVEFKLRPKTSYQTSSGIKGELRTFAAPESLRLTWQPKAWTKPSTLQLYVMANGLKTALGFHHEKLKDAKSRMQMKKHWQAVLEKLESML